MPLLCLLSLVSFLYHSSCTRTQSCQLLRLICKNCCEGVDSKHIKETTPHYPVQEPLFSVLQFLRGKITKIKVRLNSLGNMTKAPGTLITFLGQRNCFCSGYGNSIQSHLVNYPCNSSSIQINFHTDLLIMFSVGFDLKKSGFTNCLEIYLTLLSKGILLTSFQYFEDFLNTVLKHFP